MEIPLIQEASKQKHHKIFLVQSGGMNRQRINSYIKHDPEELGHLELHGKGDLNQIKTEADYRSTRSGVNITPTGKERPY